METFQAIFNIVVFVVCGLLCFMWKSSSGLNLAIKFLLFVVCLSGAALSYHALVH